MKKVALNVQLFILFPLNITNYFFPGRGGVILKNIHPWAEVVLYQPTHSSTDDINLILYSIPLSHASSFSTVQADSMNLVHEGQSSEIKTIFEVRCWWCSKA